jgi:hypothetical protein
MGRIEMGRIAVSYKKLAQRLEHEAGAKDCALALHAVPAPEGTKFCASSIT